MKGLYTRAELTKRNAGFFVLGALFGAGTIVILLAALVERRLLG